MKKLLLTIALGVGFNFAFAAGQPLDCNNFITAGNYPIASNPVSSTHCPPISSNGTITVSRPNNGIYPTVVMQSLVTDIGQIFGRYRNESLTWSSWIQGGESTTAIGLTNTHIFVGNAGNIATDVAASGAMTLANTGVFTPVTSAFFTTPSTGSTNNVLTGGQVRAGSVPFTAIAALSESVVTVTYGTTCTTGAYAVQITPLEATANLHVSAKLRSQTASGFVAAIQNESAATTQAGTLFYTTTCH